MTDQNQDNQNPQEPVSPVGYQQENQGQPLYQGQPNYGGQENMRRDFSEKSDINNYLVLNIIATVVGLFTCWWCCISGLVGVVGIIYSSQVNSKLAIGDIEAAKNSSKVAKILMIVSFSLTALAMIYFVYAIFALIASGELDTVIEQYKEALEQYN